jgi:phosphoglycolate phosphatase
MKNTLKSPAYIFDLDGTLVDTAPDLLTTLNTILAHEGCRPIEPGVLRQLVGRGARVLITEALKLNGKSVDPVRLEVLFETFLQDYVSHIAAASRPFPGVVETLAALKSQGVRMGVLTNKPHDPSLKLIRALRLDGYFGAVFGQGARPYLKPDPRLFDAILEELGGPGAGVAMIGDSITDVETARLAGVPVILVSYGYTPEPAAMLGADLVLDDFRAVPAAANRLLGAAPLP